MGVAVLPFLAGGAFAGQPLTDKQMDTVTAGFDFSVEEQTNFTTTVIAVNEPLPVSAGPSTPAPYIYAQTGFTTIASWVGNVSSTFVT
jgi:hypothetical protein